MFNPKTILVPTDFSDCSLNAMKNAVEIAEQFEAKITLLYIDMNDSQHMPLFYLDDAKIEEIKKRQEEGINEKLQEFIADTIGDRKIEVETVVRYGIAYDEIVEYTEEREVDLLVIASHGRSRIQKFFYGSTTERVVRSAACTVMVTRSRDKLRLRKQQQGK